MAKEKKSQAPKKTAAKEAAEIDLEALKEPGFLLDPDDPFAEGTARTYAAAKGIDTPRLPVVLPFADKLTKTALQNYIVRAAGGGDNKRADSARSALGKCK